MMINLAKVTSSKTAKENPQPCTSTAMMRCISITRKSIPQGS